MRLSAITSAAICCWALVVPSYAATIIHAGVLIDGRHDEPRSEMSITIDEGRIVSVAQRYIQPKDGDKLIRLTDYME